MNKLQIWMRRTMTLKN